MKTQEEIPDQVGNDGLPAADPGEAFGGGVVEVAVGGLGKEFAAGVLDGNEILHGGVLAYPTQAFGG